jgi:hypothetical protein
MTLNARALLAAAKQLVATPSAATEGLWPRAAAILARQALESHLREFLATAAPGAIEAPFRTRLLLLRELHPNKALATRAAYTWAALSEATHHHGYELAPTVVELASWLVTVEELVATPAMSRKTRG